MGKVKREDDSSGCWSGAIYMFENRFTVPVSVLVATGG